MLKSKTGYLFVLINDLFSRDRKSLHLGTRSPCIALLYDIIQQEVVQIRVFQAEKYISSISGLIAGLVEWSYHLKINNKKKY